MNAFLSGRKIQTFRWYCWLHLCISTRSRKLDAASYFEASISLYRTSRRHVPQVIDIQFNCRHNFAFRDVRNNRRCFSCIKASQRLFRLRKDILQKLLLSVSVDKFLISHFSALQCGMLQRTNAITNTFYQ
jgi:hypothetical protein